MTQLHFSHVPLQRISEIESRRGIANSRVRSGKENTVGCSICRRAIETIEAGMTTAMIHGTVSLIAILPVASRQTRLFSVSRSKRQQP